MCVRVCLQAQDEGSSGGLCSSGRAAGFSRCPCFCVSLSRRVVPEAGCGDHGGAGLVSGSAGNHPDVPLRQRHGLQQGEKMQHITLRGPLEVVETLAQ